MTRPAENDVMSVSELSNSGAPMKAAIGVPLAALTRNETSCADDRPSECLNSSAEPWPSRSCSVRKVDIASEIADLDREMDNLRRKAPSIAVSHIQKIGGGGAAHLSGVDDAIKTTAKEASAMRKTLEDHGKTLHEIARNTHSGRWK